MKDTPSTHSTPARVARRTGLIVVALVASGGLFADPVRGEDPAKATTPRAVLNLADGGVVPGELVDSDRPKAIRWKAEPFTSPFDFASEAVRSIRFPSLEKPTRAAGAFGFKLAGGDLVFGSIVGLDDQFAELDVARLGRVRVERSRVRQVFRWKDGADLLYNGPNGLVGWRELTPPKPARAERANPPAPAMNIMINGNLNAQAPAPAKPKVNPAPLGPAWVDDGGPVQTRRDGATIQANVGLPTRSSIELELSWKQSPDFVLALGVSDDEKTVARAFRLEVWEGQLVALRELDKEADIAPIQPAPLGSGRAHLQLYLDQELGRLLVFADDGRAVADLKIGAKAGPSLPEVRLTNIRGDVRLEQFRVGRWDGETPHPVGANESRVQLTDSSVIRGAVDRFDAATREFVIRGDTGEESRAPEDRVEGIYLARPDDDAPRAVRLVYQDGTQLSGDWSGVEGGKLVLSVPGIAGSLRVAQEGLRALDVLGSVAKPRDKDELVGTLEMEGLKLFGRLVDSSGQPGEGGLAWQPLGSESPASLRPGASGRISYRTTPPVISSKTATATRQPVQVQVQRVAGGVALQPIPGVNQPDRVAASLPPTVRKALYLRSGDIIPVEVTKIDEKGVSFQTTLSESGFVPNDRIKAVELASENPASIRVNKAKFERLLTLPRMQKDSPPTHLIRSKNGDILRGRVVAMDDKTIGVEIRLEEKVIPRDRISRIIWLHADETDPSKKVAPAPEVEKSSKVQAVRSDGIRLTFRPERFEAGILIGQSEVLGVCKVRPQELDQLLIGDSVEKEATQLAYQNFKLQNATEPKAVQFENSGSPGGGGAEGTEAALVGKPAPDFTLELLGGPKFHLAENKGHVVVLDFWATWCGPCIQAMPQIDKVTREFADQGVQLIAVNLQEGPEKIKSMLERQKLNPTVALDRDGVVAEKYGANAIPQTVVIDREGKVTRLFIGGGPRLGDQLREALQAALAPAGQPEAPKP